MKALVAALLFLAACEPAKAPPKPVPSAQDLANRGLPWPPVVGQPYPDLTLLDADGASMKLSSLKGKVLLIEPIGMTCPACNAFAGANRPEIGRFEGIAPQDRVLSAGEIFAEYEVDPTSPGLAYVHLLLYGMKNQGTTPDDARRWSAHFKPGGFKNRLVLAAGQGMVNKDSAALIPGFQLVDKNFILRYDAAGHHPKNGWGELFPAIPRLLRE